MAAPPTDPRAPHGPDADLDRDLGRDLGLDLDLGLGSWPRRRARISPSATALTGPDGSLTYTQLAARVETVAGALAAAGVGAGDRVAHLGANDVSTFETFFACGRLGAVFSPLNTRLAAPEVLALLRDVDARVLVIGRSVPDLVDRLRAEPGLPPLLGVDDLRAGADRARPPVAVRLEDPALLLFTSGTTGRAKAATLTHGNLTWNMVNQLAHLDVVRDDRALCIAPLFHAVGLGQITLPVLFKGGNVRVLAGFDAGEVLRRIESEQITAFSCVPTMLELMAEHPDWERRELGSLRIVCHGGAPAPDRVLRPWRDRGVPLTQGYGMTEAAPGVMMVPAGDARPPAVGTPHFFTDVAGAGPDGAALPFPTDRPAELLVRGPHVFAGYWGRPDETAPVLRDGWYRTGDVLVQDGDGWFTVVDRIKDLYISGGENVYPAEIETLLLAVPGVRGAAVVGRPDRRWGEVGVAYVERTDDAEGAALTADRLAAHLDGRLARYKRPAAFELVDALPRNPTGKVLRTELRTRAARTHEEIQEP